MRRLPLLLILPPLVAATVPGAPLTVVVSGVDSGTGDVRVEVCPEARFLKPNCPYAAKAPARPGATTVTIDDVPPGTYAVQAYWDRNENGKLDRNIIGLPMERIGFSNDARVRMAPPRFAEAAFRHDATPQRLAFEVRKIP